MLGVDFVNGRNFKIVKIRNEAIIEFITVTIENRVKFEIYTTTNNINCSKNHLQHI